MKFELAVLPFSMIYDGIWDVSFYLALYDELLGTCRLAVPSREAVCGTRRFHTELRMIGF